MTNKNGVSTGQQKLLDNLARELFQTEKSASKHCRREADRLRATPPAVALRAVATHADAVLAELPAMAKRSGLIVSEGGKLTGALFSQVRDKVADLLIDRERSYRGTMLGCRHGLDVVHLLHQVAIAMGNTQLDDFCSAWLNTRLVLVKQLEEELAWFAKHPDEAVQFARPPLPTRESRTAS